MTISGLISRLADPGSAPVASGSWVRNAERKIGNAARKNCGDLECPLGRWVTEGIRRRKQ
jgi:hypothetical protein